VNRLSGSKLVLLNTAATYTRMFICAVLGLWSSRWVLAALGQVDFGLYAVVAGIMGFLGFLTGAMTGSVLRHFAYAIGQKDNDAVNCWFNASLALHGGLAVFMVIIGIPFGWFMLKYILAIPPDRMIACHMVFMWTLVAMIVSVLSVPFTGMFVS
jgi:Na+-driven multidrug efflux pump